MPYQLYFEYVDMYVLVFRKDVYMYNENVLVNFASGV